MKIDETKVKDLEPHQQRVLFEAYQLAERIDALQKFQNGAYWHSLNPEDRDLLDMQLSIMVVYLMVLKKRLQRFGIEFVEVSID